MKQTDDTSSEAQEFAKLFVLYRENIEVFAQQVFGVSLSPKQREFCEAFRTKRRISFKGGTGFGKTFVISLCFWWSLICHEEVQVSILGPSEPNLKATTWKEIQKFYDKMASPFRDTFTVSATRISHNVTPASCFGEYRLANKDNVSSIRGIHMRNNFVFVDESTGVDDEVFIEGLGGIFADINPKLCIVSNPSRASGYFFRTWLDPDLSSIWTHVHGTFWDSPNYDPVSFEETAKSFGGPTSRDYRVMIEGEFPLTDVDGLISRELIDFAVTNDEFEPKDTVPHIWGLDVAGGKGSDASVLMIRHDCIVFEPQEFPNLDAVRLAEKIADLYQKTPKAQKPAVIAVDSTGFGSAYFDILKDFGLPVYACNFAGTPTRGPEKYVRVRDQIWCELKDFIHSESVKIPNHAKLIADLATVQYEEANGKIKLEDKKQLRKRLGRSPDFGDALALTFAVSKTRYASKHSWSKALDYGDLRRFE